MNNKEVLNYLDEVDKSNTKVEDFKIAILVNTIIRIRNCNGDIVWACNDGSWRDKRFDGFEVDQEIDVREVIKNLRGLIKNE